MDHNLIKKVILKKKQFQNILHTLKLTGVILTTMGLSININKKQIHIFYY